MLMNSKIAIGVIVLVLIIAGLFLYSKEAKAPAPGGDGEQVFCTADAKICPDGSAVGRIPPSCEFAACPAPVVPENMATVTASLKQAVNALDLRLTPLTVLEDSRCPVDVVCIQAGTVKLTMRMTTGATGTEETIGLGETIPFEGHTIEFEDASPVPRASQTIKPEDYRFTFHVHGPDAETDVMEDNQSTGTE